MILIKQHNSHQVAHLYEHLFCMAVDDFFYENKLFPYLDYAVTGRTLHGVVYVEIDFYTHEAKQLAAKLPSLKITVDKQAYNIALIQLGSELEQALGVLGQGNAGSKMVIEEAYKLDAQSWKNIDEVAVIDPRMTELVPGSLFTLKDKKEIPTKKIEVSYALDRSFAEGHKELLPLFISIAKLMSANVSASLCRQFGFCPDGISYIPEHHATKIIHVFRVTESLEVGIEDIRQVVQDALFDLYEEKVFSRLVSELSQAATSNPERLFPDPYTLYKRTDIIIGAEGWRRIATEENCKTVLSHMKVVMRAGRNSASLDVASTPSLD